jgi:beta-N-acetylglucosaminidase
VLIGTSNYAVNRNNIVGWNAVDSNPNKAKRFKSKDDCILYVADKLKTNYLSENGIYFEGYSARAIDVHYCTDKEHADKIINIVEKLNNKL